MVCINQGPLLKRKSIVQEGSRVSISCLPNPGIEPRSSALQVDSLPSEPTGKPQRRGEGPRKHGPYIAVNCGAIPEGTMDSELFGHEKGAFTGAIETRKGYFEVANGGTIFLDEVADLPLATQVRLLRVLQSGEFIKVGSSKVQKTNVRVVAATNVNIQVAMQQGKFREEIKLEFLCLR